MSSNKLENIYKLLTEQNFDAKKNVPEKFKCGKCRKILIKACQPQCGCRFCRSCVDEMMNNGCQFCPGITSDCKIESFSNVVIDHRANKQISKLIMKCPEEMCSYECELLEMSEHLRICGKKSVECPFYKLGCDMRKMTNEKLIEHFQLENYNHNKTLIEMIDNIKNEVEIMKKEKSEMEKRLKKVEESIMKINQLEGFVENKMKGIFEMMIDNVDDMRKKYKYENEKDLIICSEYFYARNRPYKLRLCIYLSSSRDKLRICLHIYDDVVNQYLSFPFSADVTIKIINKNNREIKCESIPPKYCEIEKPKNNSYNESDLFIYSIPELTESGIFESNKLTESGILESNRGFIVQCCVELK